MTPRDTAIADLEQALLAALRQEGYTLHHPYADGGVNDLAPAIFDRLDTGSLFGAEVCAPPCLDHDQHLLVAVTDEAAVSAAKGDES